MKPPELKRVYENYIKGESPRKGRGHKDYAISEFPSVDRQLSSLLEHSAEFETELPNPDIQRNYIAMHRFGKPRK